ncbi:MCP methyltransferase, CheR-type [Chitinophaga jiangningensis]|uniref:MCP methyltransferase, CheR-type n=1 Tax=Chitinophaga jiangningensis TaxID=1419482 RepID=A0A1M7F8F5_9BACT|nr:protein-glutamate O-methyltransferase CheR [Chitinophaga jiangningensis]SHM00344.1 MCP methyltransferase, CheR-type [Chitinophaga jiangningensis]
MNIPGASANMISELELDLLLRELLQEHGYDFTSYARNSMRRRVSRLMVIDRFANFQSLLYRLRLDTSYLQRMVEELTVNVTEMFRDPSVWRNIREQVLPVLATHPFIRIWHAGCSSGEEVYSMAILLEEADLLHKSLLYATDLNPAVVENIKRGVFPLSQMKQYSENYIASGGVHDFSRYYTAKYNWAKFDEKLKARMVASTHNLVSDRSFNEFNLILCRNVLIYFERPLQEKVLQLFDDSLEKLGFLVLGTKENMRFSSTVKRFIPVDYKDRIWRKMG